MELKQHTAPKCDVCPHAGFVLKCAEMYDLDEKLYDDEKDGFGILYVGCDLHAQPMCIPDGSKTRVHQVDMEQNRDVYLCIRKKFGWDRYNSGGGCMLTTKTFVDKDGETHHIVLDSEMATIGKTPVEDWFGEEEFEDYIYDFESVYQSKVLTLELQRELVIMMMLERAFYALAPWPFRDPEAKSNVEPIEVTKHFADVVGMTQSTIDAAEEMMSQHKDPSIDEVIDTLADCKNMLISLLAMGLKLEVEQNV